MSRHRKRRGGVSSGDAIAWRRAWAWASAKKQRQKPSPHLLKSWQRMKNNIFFNNESLAALFIS
jgi:hypothetical protein